MCGIAGILANLPAETISSALRRMNEAMRHRGPDDQGVWSEDGFGFSMQRLSIIDLQMGGQPMWDNERDLGIVYNGETYNYRDLRSQLEGKGETFVTNSDTEVILKALAVYGESALDLMNGMYGAALWDSRQKKLLLFRDRLGIKPLYYYYKDGTLIFSSEIKSILASGLIEPEVNNQAVWDYLTFRYVPEPETIWHGIRKLPPGHLLRVKANSAQAIPKAYWRIENRGAEGPYDSDHALHEFEELFLDAVDKRLVASDVPVGVLLSGGLDSSAVAAAAVELGHTNFHTFSVGFKDGGEYSELPYARAMANHVGAQHHEITIGQKEFMGLLPEMVHASDEPLADLASIPLLAVSRLAREHVKVVLSGEGSDEILAGYNFDVRQKKWRSIERLQKLPKAAQKALRAIAPMLGPRGDALTRALSIPLCEWNSHFPAHMTEHWTEVSKRRLWPGFHGERSLRSIERLYSQAVATTPLEQMLYVFQRDWLVEDLLMKADKMTMYASLELRVPFLDYRLVEWAGKQVDAVKIGGCRSDRQKTKRVLRQFAEKRLPRKIIDRPKQGFPVPAYRWLRDKGFAVDFNKAITESAFMTDRFEGREIERTFETARSGDVTEAHKLWLLRILAEWGSIYWDKKP